MVIVTDRVPRIGEILMQHGFVDRVKIELALDEQKSNGESLGEILVTRGQITREQLHQALMEQFRMQILAGVISVAIAFGTPFASAIADGRSGSITLRGIVPSTASVEIVKTAPAHITGDLRIPHTGEVVTITERSNVPMGYRVTIASEAAQKYGSLVLENSETRETVPYRLTYAGQEVQLESGRGLLTNSNKPAINGIEKILTMRTAPSSQLTSGVFTDVLTLTIEHNR